MTDRSERREPNAVDTDEFELEQELRDLYHNPGTGYRRFQKGTGRKSYRKTVVQDLGQQLQLDLVDMTEGRKDANNGYRWILTSIEVLSRYAFTEPSKTKGGKDVA